MRKTFILFLAVLGLWNCQQKIREHRDIISLNGEWQLAEGNRDQIPKLYERTVVVPGTVDMATPPFDSVGYVSSKRSHFWYKTTFEGPLKERANAQLKFYKAKFGIKVWLNGEELGIRQHCFTPAVFDASAHLRYQDQNELVVRIGADPSQLPDSIVWGHDFEKLKYLPGIYDQVELILSDAPFIKNVQIIPNVQDTSIRVMAWLESNNDLEALESVQYEVLDKRSGKQVTAGKVKINDAVSDKSAAVDFSIPLLGCQLWSPDNPQLYMLKLSTNGDTYETDFGIRHFKFDPETGFAELNGETIFLRGTNVCIFRFMEDEARGDLVWDRQWVRDLYEKMHEHNLNSMRFCIGFPPEFWYDLADEMGILVQDEYPIWYGAEASNFPELFTSTQLAREFKEWMQERWNHPCVVTWDAQNESVTNKTGEAIQLVRHFDLSDRPWDNGYSPPQRPSDPIETHPYVLQNYLGKKPGDQGPLFPFLSNGIRIPDNGPNDFFTPEIGERFNNPIVNNENVFFWLNRNGLPTALTRYIYKNLYDTLPKDQYYVEYSKTFERLISYWRIHRTSAAVQYFCILGYSRGTELEGFTSDNFVDVANLQLHPEFEPRLHKAFYPIGILIDRWEAWFAAGAEVEIPIRMINDLNVGWKGEVIVNLEKGTDRIQSDTISVVMDKLGTYEYMYPVKIPDELGDYRMTAAFVNEGELLTEAYEFEVKASSRGSKVDSEVDNIQFIHDQQ